jgi:hypothetical protein
MFFLHRRRIPAYDDALPTYRCGELLTTFDAASLSSGISDLMASGKQVGKIP